MRSQTLLLGVAAALIAGGGIAAEPPLTLRVLALDRPQAQAEQRLADARFTPATGIKVILETNSTAELRQKLLQAVGGKDSRYDLVHYQYEWLGELVMARALERLDSPGYFGERARAATNANTEADLAISTNTALAFADFRPEITYRVAKYPTMDNDLFQRSFDGYEQTPIYGMPWSAAAQVLAYRDDLVGTAFAKVQPAVAQFYQTYVEPDWKNQWRVFVSAAGLVQIVYPNVSGAFARGRASPDGILEDFLPILWSFGGEIWDEAGGKTRGILNSASNIKALEFYCEWNLKRKIVSTNSANWGDSEAVTAIAEGKAAMGQLWPWCGPYLDDRSPAAGRVSYAMVPGVDAVVVRSSAGGESAYKSLDALKKLQTSSSIRRAALYGCDGVGISSFSKQKQAAWRYLQWLLSRDAQLALIFEPGSGFCSARRDLSKESQAAGPRNRAVMDEFDASMVRSSWNSPEAAQLDTILARECNLAFRGQKSAKDALDAAAKETQAILEQAKKKSE